MKTKIVIITGGSKGIGKALVTEYLKNNYLIYNLSRTKTNLDKAIKQICLDITNTNLLQKQMDVIFTEIQQFTLESITLINNAGRLGTIANIENIAISDIQKSIALNILAPMQLSSIFIKKLQNESAQKTIINITSGAASSPYAGWTPYCSSKAALEMLTKTITLEQQTAKHPVKIVAIRPGVVATAMQEQIRNTSKSNFKKVDKFIDLYKANTLSTTTDVATKIYEIDATNKLKSGDIIDLRNV